MELDGIDIWNAGLIGIGLANTLIFSTNFFHAPMRGLMVVACLIAGQVTQAAELDEELKSGIDFRDIAFRVCMQAARCNVMGMSVSAEARRSDHAPWEPGLLYWDPIDGLGVLGGGQDDEIDFNERIRVRPSEPLLIRKVWLTDLFSGEITHYRGLYPALPRNVDFEAGRITFPISGEETREIELRGVLDLPDLPFNVAIDGAIFTEPGDLHYRLLVADGEVLLSIPRLTDDGRFAQKVFSLDRTERDKLNLFGDGDELAYDLDNVFSESETLYLFPIGQHNADAMASILKQTERLQHLRSEAGLRRDTGDIPNGEVGAQFDTPLRVVEIVFHAPAGTSNDFSVAGLVLAE